MAGFQCGIPDGSKGERGSKGIIFIAGDPGFLELFQRLFLGYPLLHSVDEHKGDFRSGQIQFQR